MRNANVYEQYNIGADDVPGLNARHRATLDALGTGARIAMLLCEDEAGRKFTMLGPVRSLDKLPAKGSGIDDEQRLLFPLERPGWPKIG